MTLTGEAENGEWEWDHSSSQQFSINKILFLLSSHTAYVHTAAHKSDHIVLNAKSKATSDWWLSCDRVR